MHATLISSLSSNPTQLEDLERALSALKSERPDFTFWLRDKDLPTSDLPLKRLRSLAQNNEVRLSWSWCHRSAAINGEKLHIPDDDDARFHSANHGLQRVLSCHDLTLAKRLLASSKSDHVLLSPWRHSIGKTTQGELLDKVSVLALARHYPARVHLVSGLVANDLSELAGLDLASLCFKGEFRVDPLGFLHRLVAVT